VEKRQPERPLHHRLLAGLALLALLAAFGITGWWVMTDAIQLGERAKEEVEEAASEAP